MRTTARRCAGCGGPLPETAAQQYQIACRFCGIVNDLSSSAPPSFTVRVDVDGVGRAASRVTRHVLLLVLAIVIVATLVAGWVIHMAIQPATDAARAAASSALPNRPGAVPSRRSAIAPGALATTTDAGWRQLEVPAPPTAWSAFDPIANLPWAMTVARAWQADARLTRIDVTRLTPAGQVDVSTSGDDHTVGYRFVSPSKIEEWGRRADRGDGDSVGGAAAGTELMLRIAGGTTTALVTGAGGRSIARELPPSAIEVEPFGALIAAALRTKSFAAHPFYNGYLIHLEREGWVLYLQSLSQREPLPRIRARDGAVYPYPRGAR